MTLCNDWNPTNTPPSHKPHAASTNDTRTSCAASQTPSRQDTTHSLIQRRKDRTRRIHASPSQPHSAEGSNGTFLFLGDARTATIACAPQRRRQHALRMNTAPTVHSENTHRITPTSKVLSSQHHRCAHEHALLLHNTPSHEAHPSQRIAIVWTPMSSSVLRKGRSNMEKSSHTNSTLHSYCCLQSHTVPYRIAPSQQSPNTRIVRTVTVSIAMDCITAFHSRMNNTRFSLGTPAITIPSFSFNLILQLHSAMISIHSKPRKDDTTQQRESTPLPRRFYNCWNTSHTHQHANRRRNRFLTIPCSGVGSFQTIITITQNPHKPSSSQPIEEEIIPTNPYPTQSLHFRDDHQSSPTLAPQRKQRLPSHSF